MISVFARIARELKIREMNLCSEYQQKIRIVITDRTFEKFSFKIRLKFWKPSLIRCYNVLMFLKNFVQINIYI